MVTGGRLKLGFLGFLGSSLDDNRLQRGFLGQDGGWPFGSFMNEDDVFSCAFRGGLGPAGGGL